MVKGYLQVLIKSGFTGILLALHALVMLIAIYVGHQHGAEAARALVYDTIWFAILWALLAVNLAGNLMRLRMHRRERLPHFLFHAAFLVVMLAATITHFTGKSGEMHLREAHAYNYFLSDGNYLYIKGISEGDTSSVYRKVYLSNVGFNRDGHMKVNGKKFTFHVADYFSNAVAHMVDSRNGKPILELSVYYKRNVGRLLLQEGEQGVLQGKRITLGRPVKGALNLKYRAGNVFFSADDTVRVISPDAGREKVIKPGGESLFRQGEIVKWQGREMALNNVKRSAKLVYANQPGTESLGGMQVMRLEMEHNGKTRKAYIRLSKVADAMPKIFTMHGTEFYAGLGSKKLSLPFTLQLKNLEIKQQAKTSTTRDYISTIVLDDPAEKKRSFKVHSYDMFRHNGYRFYIKAYAFDDRGSAISAHYNPYGSWIAYGGYVLFLIASLAALIVRHSRLQSLFREIRPRAKWLVVLLAVSIPAITHATELPRVPDDHAIKFRQVLVKNENGRMQPMGAVAHRLVKKLAGREAFPGYTPSAVVLAVMLEPQKTQQVPFLKINNERLRGELQMEGPRIAFEQLFNIGGEEDYKLSHFVEIAYMKLPENRDPFDKAVIAADEKVSIMARMYSGRFFSLFPDSTKRNWRSPDLINRPGGENEALDQLFYNYLNELQSKDNALNANSETAGETLQNFIRMQRKAAGSAAPPELRIKLELLYYKVTFLPIVALAYAIPGVLLILLAIWYFFVSPGWGKKVLSGFKGAIIVVFLVHLTGLALLSYLFGHNALSTGYDILVYLSAAALLPGFLFLNKSPATLGFSALFAALLLFTAHKQFVMPEVSHGAPTLKSAWFYTYEAFIMISHAFLGLAALLAFVNLTLMVFRLPYWRRILNDLIGHFSRVNEVLLLIGLFTITLSLLMHTVWSNEALGRLWGWTPQESWLLLLLLVYTFIAHMRLIPGFKGFFALNLGAVAAYSVVAMIMMGVTSATAQLQQEAGKWLQEEWLIAGTVMGVFILGAFFNENKLGVKKDHPER